MELDVTDIPLAPLAPCDARDRHLHRSGRAASATPRPSLPLHVLRLPVGEIAHLPLATAEFSTRPDLFPKQRPGPHHEQYVHAHPPQPARSHLRRRHFPECLGRRRLLVLCGNLG